MLKEKWEKQREINKKECLRYNERVSESNKTEGVK